MASIRELSRRRREALRQADPEAEKREAAKRDAEAGRKKVAEPDPEKPKATTKKKKQKSLLNRIKSFLTLGLSDLLEEERERKKNK